MSRLGVVLAMAFGSLAFACGDGDEPPATPAVPDTPDPGAEGSGDEVYATPEDREWGLHFTISGRTTPMTARAELAVNEGEDEVHLAITGRTTDTDLMQIELTFDGLEGAFGEHAVTLSLPDSGIHFANGSLDDIWYYSQGGEVTVNMTHDGNIRGSFNIALARGEFSPPGAPPVFEADAEATPLTGEFEGPWVLFCHSRLRGHQTLIPGGQFCDNLTF